VERVKIIQLSSDPEAEREVRSFESLSKLGYRYIRMINPRYSEFPPTHNVFDGRIDWIVGITKPDPNKFGLTSGHYGAWQGHTSCILSSFCDDDYTIICECDCIINVDDDHFRDMVSEAINAIKMGYKIARFEGTTPKCNVGKKISDNMWECDLLTLGHCYMISSRDMYWWMEKIRSVGWHTPDWWINFVFERSGEKMACFGDSVLTKQASGFSLIDNTEREEKLR